MRTHEHEKHYSKCDFHFLINFSIPLYGACIPAHRKNPITFIPKAITGLVNRGKGKIYCINICGSYSPKTMGY